MKIGIQITPRKGLADPQSQTVTDTLTRLGFQGVKSVSVGRWMVVDIDVQSKDEAMNQTKKMCETLLANPVVEDFQLKVMDPSA